MELLQKLKSQSFWDEMEEKRFGVLPLSITAQSCIGSVAVGFLLQLEKDQMLIPLIVVACVNMTANAITIAQTSMRSILYMCVGTFVVSIAAVLYSLLLI